MILYFLIHSLNDKMFVTSGISLVITAAYANEVHDTVTEFCWIIKEHQQYSDSC